MITGYYVIKDGDKEISRTNNLITTIGKRHILDYLANKVTDRNRYIGIGIGSTTATVADYKLDFEIGKYKVYTSTVDYSSGTIIMKAELPLQLAATITEMALFPGFGTTRQYDSKVITFFNSDVSWSEGQYITDSAVSKINNTSYQITATSGSTVTSVSSNLSILFTGYSTLDSMSFAFYQNDQNLDYIDFKFYTTDSDYYTYRLAGTTSVGLRIVNVPLATLLATTTGSPTGSIAKVSIGVKAKTSTNTTVDFDGIRINDNDTYVQESGAISRAVLSTPVIKEFGRILDLEYRLVIQ